MKKISSFTTIFKKKIIPYIVILNIIICFICIFMLNYMVESLFVIIFPTIILSLGWLLLFRKLKVVYLGKNYLKVDNTIILFKDIQSIEKLTYLRYQIHYITEKGVRSFDLNVDAMPFVTPKFIKEIEKNSKK